jgi:hypothetical protein
MHRLTSHQVIFMTPTPSQWHPWTSSCSTVDNPSILTPPRSPRTDDLDVGSGLSDILSSKPDVHQLESQGADKAAGSLRAWIIGINITHTHILGWSLHSPLTLHASGPEDDSESHSVRLGGSRSCQRYSVGGQERLCTWPTVRCFGLFLWFDCRPLDSLDHWLLLHILDGGFGSGQFKNAAESSGLWLVCGGC